MLFQCSHWYCVCVFFLQEWQNSIQKNAGLAFIELVNEGRWVTLTCKLPLPPPSLPPCSSISSLSFQPQPVGLFPISLSLDHITAPQALKVPQAPLMGWLFKILDNNQWVAAYWGLRVWGWRTDEFKASFNTCSSQRDLGKGEGLGRRWQGLWSLDPLWHLRNCCWFLTDSLSVYVFLVEPLSACNHLFCRLFTIFLKLFWASPSFFSNKSLVPTSAPRSLRSLISFRFRGPPFPLLILSF